MRIPRTEIVLNGIQIKSLVKARRLAAALSIIEEECGVRQVKITITDSFVCSWLDIDELEKPEGASEMEKLLAEILRKIA